MINTVEKKPRAGTSDVRLAPMPPLTARESGVLDLMGQGLDPQSIAFRLSISIHTCREHQKSIFTKLDAHSQLEAVVIALRQGLIGWPGALIAD